MNGNLEIALWVPILCIWLIANIIFFIVDVCISLDYEDTMIVTDLLQEREYKVYHLLVFAVLLPVITFRGLWMVLVNLVCWIGNAATPLGRRILKLMNTTIIQRKEG